MNRRQQEILHLVQQQGFVSIEALAAHFRVTPQTIRRDIQTLSDAQRLTRFHGGVGPVSSVENLAYSTRQRLYPEAKQQIAALAAARIPDHASIFINIGTTTEEVARALRHHTGLRVITNNLNVAVILRDNPSCEIIIAGGVVRQPDGGITGAATIDFIHQFKVDYGIIGISCIDPDGDLLDFDDQEVRVAQAILDNSRQVLLVADHSKFDRCAMVRLGNLTQVDALFTDREPPAAIRSLMAQGEVELHVVAAGCDTEAARS